MLHILKHLIPVTVLSWIELHSVLNVWCFGDYCIWNNTAEELHINVPWWMYWNCCSHNINSIMGFYEYGLFLCTSANEVLLYRFYRTMQIAFACFNKIRSTVSRLFLCYWASNFRKPGFSLELFLVPLFLIHHFIALEQIQYNSVVF